MLWFQSNGVRAIGIHLVLFCICTYSLLMRRNPAQLVVLLSLIIMFALATADISLSFRLIIHDVPAVLNGNIGVNVILEHVYPKNPLFVTNK
jgi:NADH:ubiquinone oxidoreductase subunit K